MTIKDDNFQAFVVLVLAVLLAILVGWLLQIGESLLLPIFIAVISVYVLVTASDWLGTLPVIGKTPEFLRRMLVLFAFIFAIAALGAVMASTAEALMEQLPVYEKNLKGLAKSIVVSLRLENVPDWATLTRQLTDSIDLQAIASWGLGSLTSMAGVIFMVIIYAMFLMGERGGFAHKIEVALPGEHAANTARIVENINNSIGDYLAVKTLVNVILAVISYAVMAIIGVDFALFWAILIGLLNYIPYVGSLLGVVFPVVLTMVQFGDVKWTIIAAVALTVAQMYVGNVLEPKMIGKKVNMSPFVVLVALGFWSAIWGIPGAILAIPLTSILAIIFASFKPTRPLAVLLADDVSVFEEKDKAESADDADQAKAAKAAS